MSKARKSDKNLGTDYRRSIDTHEHWGTPEWLLDLVRKVAPIGLDPMTNTSAIKRVRARVNWTGATKKENGLVLPWKSALKPCEIVFFNCPYGDRLPPCTSKMAVEAVLHKTPIIALLPASTGSNWWHENVAPHASAICYIHGRLSFIDCASESDFVDNPAQIDFWNALPPPAVNWSKHKSTFDSAAVYFAGGRSIMPFVNAFRDRGDIQLSALARWYLFPDKPKKGKFSGRVRPRIRLRSERLRLARG